MDKKVLGIIGGMGPAATAYFAELVTKMTDAASDKEHLDMMIYSFPSIPDRTDYILNRSNQNPVSAIVRIGKRLAQSGAECIAVPCITAHCFFETLKKEIPVEIINAVSETLLHLKRSGVVRAGITATDGTNAWRLFQHEAEAVGLSTVLPSKERQADITKLIYKSIKANRPADIALFDTVSNELRQNGAEVIILGCTELSLIKRDYEIGRGYIDASEVLAQQSVIRCGGKLKKEYECLIS